ncbi:MAG: PAS domain S-box protein [Desulfomonilaceae bacterium]|nr:PAS domain S-box protein [Desulfomonilaceae bacterium]
MSDTYVVSESIGDWLDKAGQMFLHLDESFVVVSANDRMKSSFGDPVGKRCHRFLAGNEELCTNCPVKRAFGGEKEASGEYLRKDLNGRDRWVRVTTVPIRDARGAVEGATVLLLDVTERKDSESRLTESAALLDTLVQQAPDIIFSLDSAGRFTFVNAQVETFLGYPAREMLHTPLWAHAIPEHRSQAKTLLDCAPDAVWDREMNVLCASGERKYVRVRCRPTLDESGTIVRFSCTMRDRTRQRILEEELDEYRESLSESELRYRRIVDEIPDVLFTLDPAAGFTFLNGLVEDLLGYPVEELLGTPLWDHVAPDSRSQAKTLLDTAAGAIWDEKLYLLDSKARRKYVRIRCKACALSDGTIEMFEGTIRDRTRERELEESVKTFQESLKKSEERYRNLVERVPDIIFSLDAEGRFTFLNSEAERCLRYRIPEILGTPLWDYVVPENRNAARTILDAVPDTVWDVELTVLDALGTPKLVRIRCNASHTEEGSLEGFEGVMRDRTALQKLREQVRIYQDSLRESERRYRTLVEQVPDVIFSMDPSGRFTFVNPQIQPFLGYAPHDMLGKELGEFAAPEDRALTQTLVQMSPQTVWDEEMALVTATSGTKWARVRCKSFFTEQGRVTGFEGVMRDITIRKTLEEDLKASKEDLLDKIKIIDDLYEHLIQSEKSKAIAEHTAEVAHELRQPLAIIGGFARRMSRQMERCKKLDLDTQRDCFHTIIREVQRLERILNGLIDFTKPKTLQLEKVDPNDLIEEILHINEERINEKDLSLELQMSDEIGEILVDPDRFQQAVRNLVANAIEAADQGGVIGIFTGVSSPSDRAQETGQLESGSYFELRVRNTGTEIPHDMLHKIFDPFYTTKEHGIGLGLTVVRKIVEGHKGSISVKSDGRGNVFTIWIPMRSPHTDRH